MTSDRRILVAFLLNLLFAVAEGIGGTLTGSVSILSDAVHDLGDSIGIGLSYLLEKISKKHSDARYTYGYARFSVLGSLITYSLLIGGSAAVMIAAVKRLCNPVAIEYDGMLALAILGIAVNGVAALFTDHGESLNQKAVSLHMLEDVLGWVCVLVGALVIRVTDFVQIDPLISITVSVFLLVRAVKGARNTVTVFLQKAPATMDVAALQTELAVLDGVQDIHHLHVYSLDGIHHVASVHVVAQDDTVRHAVEHHLSEHGASCITVQIEHPDASCGHAHCHIESGAHHHHY